MFNTYSEALTWLYSFADFERGVGFRADTPFDQGIERTTNLLAYFNNPHTTVPTVHIAGTKGKGSVCALVANATKVSGLRTGLYTQPHLHSFRERIQIDGRPIGEEDFVDLAREINRVLNSKHLLTSKAGPLTTFELCTAMALIWFQHQDVDLAVIEVGLGGRLDATNVVCPLVSAVTSIALEHTQLLGHSLPAIAREKAGIAKPNTRMLITRQHPAVMAAIRSVARSQGASVQDIGTLETLPGGTKWRDGRATTIVRAPCSDSHFTLGLAGRHQAQNAGLAYAICRELSKTYAGITTRAIHDGFEAIRWPARLELIESCPTVVVDGAHTVKSLEAGTMTLQQDLGLDGGPVIFGALDDKPVDQMVAALQSYATELIIFESGHPRTAAASDMQRAAHGMKTTIVKNAAESLRLAKTSVRSGQGVLATGSLAVAADVRAASGLATALDPPNLWAQSRRLRSSLPEGAG